MFTLMAGYRRTKTGAKLGDSLRCAIRSKGLTEENVYYGHCDKAAWSKQLSGEHALDLNLLFDALPMETFTAFISRVLCMKTEQYGQQLKREADEAAGKVA